MGQPGNTVPPRPPTVPAEARWDPGKHPGFEWKLGELDEGGKKHGMYRSWTRDGVLHAETMYEHGELHGTNRNFHPDGSVSSEAEWVRGVIMDSVYFRSDHPTTEPFAQAARDVWSVRYFTRDGRTNYTIRYFTRAGVECGPDGKPLPLRPKSVVADARWFPELDRWVDGEIERGTNAQVGRWRWWTRDGVLRREELRDARGEASMIADYRADGSLDRKSIFDERGRQIYKGRWLRDGSLDEEWTRAYDVDGLASVTERTAGGALLFEAKREGRAMACVLYGKDGKTPAAMGLVEDDRLAGTWRLCDATGAVRREAALGEFALDQAVSADGLEWTLGEALYMLDEPTLPDVPELAGIDDEPWAELDGAYSDHVDRFPRLFRALASPDPLVRRYALAGIDSEIEHQGSTYPATRRALPYLARLLAHPNVDRAPILEILQCAGEPESIAAAWPHVREIYARASLEERRKIVAIAKLAPEARKSVLEVARADPDPHMRACAIDSLAAPEGPVADLMPALADRDLLVRAAAAVAIACAKGPETPREVVHALNEAIRVWRETAPRFAQLPYVDGHLLSYLAVAAGSIGTPDARSLAHHLYPLIDECDARSAVTFGQGLLALAFGRGDRPFAKRFVEILDALARSKHFWVFDVNAHEVLDAWNLPRSPQEVAALVAELQVAGDPESFMHQRMHRSDQSGED